MPAVEGWQRSILPRTGGFWFGAPTPVMEIYAVDNEGTVSGGYRPLGDREFTYRGDMAPWRDGVALASSGQESGGFTVAVTDGEHTTSLSLSGDETNFCHNGISVLASPYGDSVYVGYLRCPSADISFTVRRFDCAAE